MKGAGQQAPTLVATDNAATRLGFALTAGKRVAGMIMPTAYIVRSLQQQRQRQVFFYLVSVVCHEPEHAGTRSSLRRP